MECELCNAPMTERQTTRDMPYFYTLAGLPHVGLVGITVVECQKGHAAVPRIPKIGELHRVIADAFVNKAELLTGAELRFLRKNAGFSAQKFAALLIVDPAYLSRVENGKQKGLGPSTDRLARLIVLAALKGGDKIREVLLSEANATIEQKKQKKRAAAMFKLDEKNHWRKAA